MTLEHCCSYSDRWIFPLSEARGDVWLADDVIVLPTVSRVQSRVWRRRAAKRKTTQLWLTFSCISSIMPHCQVGKCTSNAKKAGGLHFHHFPKEEPRRSIMDSVLRKAKIMETNGEYGYMFAAFSENLLQERSESRHSRNTEAICTWG